MAQGLPSHDLTADSRALNHCLKDWHRLDNHEFDLQLDFLWAADSPPKDTRAGSSSENHRRLDWPMDTPNQATDVGAGADAACAAADAQPSNATTGATHQTPVPEATGDTLSHVPNEFDNPEYQVQDPIPGEQSAIPMAQAYSSSSSESIQERAASMVMNPSSLTATSAIHVQAQAVPRHQPMQRGLTDSNIPLYTNWGTNSPHGLPDVNGAYYQPSNGQQIWHPNIQKVSNVVMSPYSRPRAQTSDVFPTSHFSQQHPSYYGSNVRQSMPTNGYDNQNGIIYPPAHNGTDFLYQPNIANGKCESGSTSFRSSDPYAVHFSTTPSSAYSDISAAQKATANTYNNVLPANSMRKNVNNNRSVGTSNNHHINSGQIVDPTDLQIHQHQQQAYMAVPASKTLKSQSSCRSDATESTPMSSKRKPRNAAKQQRPQEIDVEEEEEEEEEQEEENFNEVDAQEPDVNYTSIEAARQAERPRFRANPNKDETIPRTDRERQWLVQRMVRCMRATKQAEDNEGMVKQWVKLKQDGPRVEQAAWRILDMVLQLHVDGIPLLPNKPSCNRYAKLRDRWDAICEGLYYQKTMCKHLLGAEFTAQLVNDPATATIRVQNNRKVNAGKKTWLDKGRRVSHDEGTKKTLQGSPFSIDDDSFLGALGDDDAEGEIDDEYSALTLPTNNSRRTVPQSTPTPASAPARGYKHELDAEESDYGVNRAKKKPRQTSSSARRAPTKGNSKGNSTGNSKGNSKGSTKGNTKGNMRKQRAPGSHSKYQAINGVMIDITEKRHEELVYREASPDIQDLFTKHHYPDGRPSTYDRPSETNESRRSSRAAAPTTFRGVDNSDEITNGDSGSPYEATDDDYHQGAHR
ncbi:MAG: hypothetical protein Q9196_003699 [Gyalolechia fulgens]